MSTIQQLLEISKKQLSEKFEGELLLSHVLTTSRAYLLGFPEKKVSPAQEKKFNAYLQRRKAGEPIAYILKEKEFWSMRFNVNKYTLIPRPETELIIETVQEILDPRQSWKFLELGTGSGVISIVLAKIYAQSIITAIDISHKALETAKKNQAYHALKNINFIKSNWFTAINISKKYHMIISNPPYLADNDEHLKKEDLAFEPFSALAAGKTGMEALTLIISQAPYYLQSKGYLIVEHGFNQGQAVQEIFQKSGFDNLIFKKDLNGLARMTAGQYNKLDL